MNPYKIPERNTIRNGEDLKTIVIRDLHAKGTNVINLKNGIFDLLIEGSNPMILELKMITNTSKRGYTETKAEHKCSRQVMDTTITCLTQNG